MTRRLASSAVLAALALLWSAAAHAQEVAVTEATERPRAAKAERSAPAPAPARLRWELRRVDGGKVNVGRRFTAVGLIKPFVPGQRIRVAVKQDRRTIKRVNLAIRPAGEQRRVGRFDITSPPLVKPDLYRVRAKKIETPEQEGVLGGTGNIRVDYPDLDPGDDGRTVKLFNELLKKRAYYTSRSRNYGSATQRAVLAFRKVNNMARTTNAIPGIFKALAAGKGGFDLKWPRGGKHVEVDLSRQVMVLANHGKAQHTFHISSGAPATPTVRGKFSVYRFEPGYNSKRMYYSVYFHRGYATHGYDPVPTYPASHGCLRNPIPNSVFIYNWLDYGDVFYIYS